MEETVMLITLTLVMLIGSFVAGSIPLFFSFSEEKLKRITAYGAGLLVGTALAVIIPEGVRSLLEVKSEKSDPDHHDIMSVIGVTLVLGFIFMLLVDQISQSKNENLNPSERNVTATIGLVVHAAADGIALGAAATTNQADVEIIVFLAIMLHKAPAAFGLVTFLLHEGIDRQRIRKHLLVFALSAPVLTICTYFGIGQKHKETLSTMNATGIAMLFSAGTFLYVATVHVLAELTQNHQHSYSKLPTADSGKLQNPKALQIVEIICLVFGCLTPLFLTFSHQH